MNQKIAFVLLSLLVVELVSFRGFSQALGDEVIYRDRQGKPQRLSGEITEYNGQQLTLRTAGRDKTIPSSQVDRVDTDWPVAQRKAEQLADDAQFAAAIQQYRPAFAQEKRRWVQRKMLADIVWCYRNAGNIEAACSTFLQLLADDRETQYFDAIPLSWQPHEPAASLRQRANGWLGSENGPAESLLGASWLLSTSDRTKAIDALRRLARHPDQRIAQLARAQLWRTEVVQTDEDRVRLWQTQIDQIPVALRAGPYFLLGRAHARLDQRDQAALAFLRIPVLYDRDRTLTQSALLAAARTLDAEPSPDEAVRLYQQAIQVDDSTAAAQQAKTRLEELSKK